MSNAMLWLSEVLLDAGLKVSPQPGWETRGTDLFGPAAGVMIHHTVGPRKGNMPSLGTIVNGRAATAHSKALSGPLANLGLGRDGTYYLVAARLAHHAGGGTWEGVTDGNGRFIGIECENTGKTDDLPWPDVQMDALRRGVAALLRRIVAPPRMCCGHREYALPPGRKIDPLFDMEGFRASVAQIMAGEGVVRPQIKAADASGRSTIRRPVEGKMLNPAQLALVGRVQSLIGMTLPSGLFDGPTEAAISTLR